MSIIAVFPLQDVLDEGKNGIGVVHRDCLLAHRRHLRCLLALHHAFFSKIRLGSIPLRWSVTRLTELKTRHPLVSLNTSQRPSTLILPRHAYGFLFPRRFAFVLQHPFRVVSFGSANFLRLRSGLVVRRRLGQDGPMTRFPLSTSPQGGGWAHLPINDDSFTCRALRHTIRDRRATLYLTIPLASSRGLGVRLHLMYKGMHPAAQCTTGVSGGWEALTANGDKSTGDGIHLE